MMTGNEQNVAARVDELGEEMLDFLRHLVRIPTVNPPGENYLDCAYFIGRKLESFGYDVDYVTPDGMPENTARNPRLNVIGRMEGRERKPTLHFNGHLDVVPPGAGWTVDPFAGLIRDGRIYGRGVTDQKAGIAASIFAVEAIRRAGVELYGSVEQSATVDEESGGLAGVWYLSQNGYFNSDRIDYVVITEPLNYDRICLGHRGVYWFEVDIFGRIAHGSMPFLGVNAVDIMARLINRIEQEVKPMLAQRCTVMPVEPPGARYATINVNSIAGGQQIDEMQTPCVADLCRAIFDRRFLIEESFDDVKGEMVDLLEQLRDEDPVWSYELKDLLVVHPTMTDPSTEIVRQTASAIEHSIGRRPPLIASPGTYDQKHFARIAGIEQCIAYGPGLLDMAHQPDEYCRIDHLMQACKTMALTTMRLLHG